MAARLSRTSAAAISIFAGLFLILTAMVVSAPARATQSDGHGGGKPAAAPTESPQPKSGADQNTGGANNDADCGAYCSTRDGSGPRNGEGKAQPCAGCEGKADNKNPPGQYKDGADHNNGYECDGNQGVAKTNPAHTGCPTGSPSPSPCVPTATNPCASPSPCVPTATNPCASPSPCVPTATNPCESPSPCVPTATDPCESPSPCVPTETEPCVPTGTPTPDVSPSESVDPTDGATPTPSISPSVRGVKIARPRTGPNAEPGALPTTGTTVPVGVLLTLGFGLVAIGVGMTVAPSRR